MARSDAHDRHTAGRVLLAGLALGLLAEWTFNGSGLGVGVLILTLATLAAGWWVRRSGRSIDPLDAWLPIAAVVLATLVAVRGDPFLAALDVVATMALVGASLAAMSGLAVTRRTASTVVAMATLGLGNTLLGATQILTLAKPSREHLPNAMPGWVAPVGRGLSLGVPLAMIFAILFASADPIFRDAIADLLGVRLDLGDLPGRALFVLSAAWFLVGALSIAATGLPPLERASLGAAARTSAVSLSATLGLTEALVILGTIDLVIGGFVALQLAYLFGGLDTLAAAGIPYAEYARRGFFELVAAACLASAVVVILEGTIERRARSFVAAVVVLIALTAIVLVSAALRLDLYQQAYGWTELRLYVAAAIAAIAVGLAVMLVLVLARSTRWLGHSLAVVGFVAHLGLNLIAPAAFVAARNIERVVDPSLVPPDGHSGLDAAYLAVLPNDAIPVLVEALPRLPEPEAAEVRAILVDRRSQLEAEGTRSPFAWNLGRERAVSALERIP